MQPLRILHTESSATLGGQELRTLAEAMGMVRRGHSVTLAVDHNSKLRERAERCGLPVELLSLRRTRALPLVLDFLEIIRRNSIQIVNTHTSLDSWTASVAARLSMVKPFVIRTRHKFTAVSRTPRHRLLYDKLPHALITTGEAVRQTLIAQTGVPESKIFSIPTGVDLQVFRPRDADDMVRHELGLDSKHPVVGTVTLLRQEKGLTYFLEAAALVLKQHPDVRFVIVGEGPLESDLRRQIDRLGLQDRVLLPGFRHDIPGMLALMDVFVLSSLEEGVPQGLTQALAMERAVVATAVGGVPEVVWDGTTGLLVNPGDAEMLAGSIARLIMDPRLRERLGQAGGCLIRESYSLARMLDRTESLYARLIQGYA